MHFDAFYTQNSALDDLVFNDIKCLNNDLRKSMGENGSKNGSIQPHSENWDKNYCRSLPYRFRGQCVECSYSTTRRILNWLYTLQCHNLYVIISHHHTESELAAGQHYVSVNNLANDKHRLKSHFCGFINKDRWSSHHVRCGCPETQTKFRLGYPSHPQFWSTL